MISITFAKSPSVLALTEFLRKERVVGVYVEFFGEEADSLSIGDRATIISAVP